MCLLQPTSTVVIQVTSLTLDSEAPILQDPNVKQLFVAYKFLDYEPADLETPISLPKPAPYRPIYYNFKKGNYETLRKIFPFLLPSHAFVPHLIYYDRNSVTLKQVLT